MTRPITIDHRPDEVSRLTRQLQRARSQNSILSTMIEDRTRSLFLAHQELRASKDYLETVVTSLSAAVITTDLDGLITSIGGRTAELAGRVEAELVGRPVDEVLVSDLDRPDPGAGDPAATHEATLLGVAGTSTPVLVTCSVLGSDDQALGSVFTAIDITVQRQLESDLRQAHRLESIGALAAGVAHELNTPIQYVADSVQFMADAIEDLFELERHWQETADGAATSPVPAELIASRRHKEDELDLAYTRQELPAAVERALTGLARVSSIVKAMRRYSHPGDEAVPTDLNQIVETAVTLARHEYKYVADVELRLSPLLPSVRANKVDISQVVVNLLINSAHAVEERMDRRTERGRISVTTGTDDEGGGVWLEVTDDGGGIPADIRHRVFEPFFTTKAEGRGTGQGLALAYQTVVDGHGGRIGVDVDDGFGTTFRIWLPQETRT